MCFGPMVKSAIGSSQMSILRYVCECNDFLSSPAWSGVSPNSVFTKIRMGVSLAQHVDVESDVPAILVRGNSDEVNWCDPKYKEFVTWHEYYHHNDYVPDSFAPSAAWFFHNLFYFRDDLWCDAALYSRISNRHSMMLVPIKLAYEKTRHLIQKPSARG